MKLKSTFGIASALLLVAGCAQQQNSLQSDGTTSPVYSSTPAQGEYSAQNKISAADDRRSERAIPIPHGKQSRFDNAMVAQVRESLRRDPEIAAVVPNLQISANNGAIFLSGSVQSEQQKRQIMSKVMQVNGVLAVNNQLSVMAGPNGGQGSGGSRLNPTSNSGAERLYQDASGHDNSTNNVLNQIPHDDRPGQLYRDSEQRDNTSNDSNAISNENGNAQIYQGQP